MQTIRQLLKEYGGCCERLLASGMLDTPLTEEEKQFIQYYVAEMEKKFDGVRYRQEPNASSQK